MCFLDICVCLSFMLLFHLPKNSLLCPHLPFQRWKPVEKQASQETMSSPWHPVLSLSLSRSLAHWLDTEKLISQVHPKELHGSAHLACSYGVTTEVKASKPYQEIPPTFKSIQYHVLLLEILKHTEALTKACKNLACGPARTRSAQWWCRAWGLWMAECAATHGELRMEEGRAGGQRWGVRSCVRQGQSTATPCPRHALFPCSGD